MKKQLKKTQSASLKTSARWIDSRVKPKNHIFATRGQQGPVRPGLFSFEDSEPDFLKRWMQSVILTVSTLWSIVVFAEESFTVKNIEIKGLHRINSGTVLNYLPVQIGEEIDVDATPQLIRALYETGFFQSVILSRKGSTLVVELVERPTIASIDLTGSTDIPAGKIKEILKEFGLVKGQVFQRAALDRLDRELKQVYNVHGKYNARIHEKVSTLTDDRVAISVTVSEGRISRIKDIKIIGAHDFDQAELLPELQLSVTHFLNYFNRKDQYSKAAMDASLESLRSFYLDRGYLKFNIISSQVLLSPDKKDVFINIHIEEGPQYHFAGHALVGKTIVPKESLDKMVLVKKGAIFSRRMVTESVSTMGNLFGDLGYGFPVINAEPRIIEADKTVFITFIINPGRHVYVRRINFHGNTKTSERLLRSIIRQNEGGLLSLHNIKESERQLKLLTYLKDINLATTPVAGTNNQVDVDISLEEAPSSEATASLGYGTVGPQLNASLNQYNFMGTGQTVGFAFNASYWGQNYNFNYYNPFYTKTGIGRGFNLYYQTNDPKKLDVSAYSSDRFGGDISYNIPVGEQSSMQFGYGYQSISIRSPGSVRQIRNFVNLYGYNFNQVLLTSGWNRNSYDQMPFPRSGSNQQAGITLALPATADSFSYYKSSYQIKAYQPFMKGFIFSTLANVSYGNTFNSKGLPFYENYFAGGNIQPGQVRGYDIFSLGPQDSTGRAIGANLLLNGSLALIMPYPISRENLRTSLFIDAGNVFSQGTIASLSGKNTGPMRYSSGVAIEWRSPLGPLAFSLAQPLNLQKGDKSQLFQFSVSSGF